MWGKLWFFEPRQGYIAFAGKGSERSLNRYYLSQIIGEEIKKRTNKGDKILSFTEETEILFYAERDSASRFTQSVMFWFPYYKDEMIRAFNQGVAAVVAFDERIPKEIKKSMEEKGFTKQEFANGFVVYWRPGLK